METVLASGFLPAILIGVVIFYVLTHPKSPIWKRWQRVSFLKSTRVQLSPSIRIKYKNNIIHFHHWFNFSVLLLISMIFNVRLLDNNLTQGLLIGGVIQGLSDPMSRKFIYHHLPKSKTYHHSF